MHIITPYDPWSPKKKKSWQEIAWEQQQVAEIEARMLAEAQHSRTLPQNSPATATPTVGPMMGQMAGGGGHPPVQYFNPRDNSIRFDASVKSTSAPLTTAFINNSSPDALQFDKWVWNFNDGTATSTEKAPNHTFFQTGSYLIALTGSDTNGVAAYTSSIAFISASRPNMPPTLAFAPTQVTGSVPLTVTFVNSTPNYSALANVYKWTFSGSTQVVTPVTTSVVTSPTITFLNTGSYAVTLEMTGSWDVTGSVYYALAVSAST